MLSFELLERDGLARLGRFETPHGIVETPALLPVVHPDPGRQPCAPALLRERYGVRAVITSAYIVWRTPSLREIAERDGVHRLLGFDGAVMTDSGAFQQHAYGSIEVAAPEILEFQNRIRSDIATVLDVFTEPEATHDEAENSLRVTEERLLEARARRTGLLAAPVQGGLHADLRLRAARAASEAGDILAIGGVVPLLERYRFAELVRILAASRPGLAPEVPVHLFGAGHPMTFGLAALFGIDLFDSSAYLKFARRGDLLLPDGTVPVDSIREEICRCALCAETPLRDVARWPPAEREHRLALHNLAVSLEEVARIRQAVREGTLWELVERRATAHPALRVAVKEAMGEADLFLPTEPESRRAFREVGPESLARPAAVRFRRRVALYLASRGPTRRHIRIPLRPEFLRHLPVRDRSDRPIAWVTETPFGLVPLELTDLYPVGPFLGTLEFHPTTLGRNRSEVSPGSEELGVLDADRDHDWSGEWSHLQLRALLEWEYGPIVAGALAPALRGERSRRTGRLRALHTDHATAFVIGTDGVPRPTFHGGRCLKTATPVGRHRVVVSEDAVAFVRQGRSLFSRFVVSSDPALVPEASALLVDRDDTLLGVGRLLLAPHEMGRFRRGVAVRVTAHADRPVPTEGDEPDADVRLPEPTGRTY